MRPSLTPALLALVPGLAAQIVKVSGPMAYGPLVNGKNVFDSDFAGARVVYRADQDTRGQVELFSVPREGGPSIRLNPPLAAQEDVLAFSVSPDGATLLFQTALYSFGARTLLRTPADGSAAATIVASPVLFATGGPMPSAPRFTPDGTRLLYVLAQTDSWGDLYVVPLAGGSALRLAREVRGFQLSPQGDRVVFERSQGSPHSLHSKSIDGGTVALLGDLHGEYDVRFVPDGRTLVYRANGYAGTSFLVYELFAVPLDGSLAPRRLTPPLAVFQRVRDFELTLDGTGVVYVADAPTPGVDELFLVPVDGSAATIPLSGSMPSTGDVAGTPAFALVRGGREVVFRADAQVDGRFDLYRAALAPGAQPERLDTPPLERFALAPGGLEVVLLSSEGVPQLYSLPLHATPRARGLSGAPWTGGGLVRLNADPVPGGGVLDFLPTPDGRSVLFAARQDSLALELYRAPLGGRSAPVRLSGPMVAGGNLGANGVPAYRVSADSTRIVYAADQETDLLVELYGAPADGSAAPVKLSGALELGPPAGDVRDFGFSPDGARFVYVADEEVDEVLELHLGATASSGPSTRLAPGLVGGSERAFTPDSARLVFTARSPDGSTWDDLYVVPSDGSAPPLLLGYGPLGEFALTPGLPRVAFSAYGQPLSVPLDGSQPPILLDPGAVIGLVPLPDGERLLFQKLNAGPFGFEPGNLHVVPLDASAPALDLAPGLGIGSTSYPQVTRGGERVAFLRGSTTFELFRAPTRGHAPALRLNPPLVAGGSVRSIALARDGRRVAYVADQEVDQRFELYSVPVDGAPPVRAIGAPARPPHVKLNGPLPSGTPGVLALALAPLGGRVAFTVEDASGNERLEAAPIDGSQPAVPLTDALSGVLALRFGPDGSRVVYSARIAPGGPLELFSVPADGGQAPVALTGALVTGGGLAEQPFEISSNGRWVVFVADRVVDGKNELFARRIDGSGPVVRLSAPLPPLGDVRGAFGFERAFALAPVGHRVLYSADQEQDDVVELYLVTLP